MKRNERLDLLDKIEQALGNTVITGADVNQVNEIVEPFGFKFSDVTGDGISEYVALWYENNDLNATLEVMFKDDYIEIEIYG